MTLIPSEPENQVNQKNTVDGLDRLRPHVHIADGSPERPRPEFGSARTKSLGTLVEALSQP